MPASSTTTIELERVPGSGGWVAPLHEPSDDHVPRLRLLYHLDPSRIGWISVPGAVPLTGEWISVGRNAPSFLGESVTAVAAPIDDRYVSREQVRIRWIPHRRVFEVAPAENARLPVFRICLPGEVDPATAPEPIQLHGAITLDPGSCIALGDRVLLGLDAGRFHQPDADRMGMIGESAALWAVRDQISALAQFQRPVLVTGPTGSGKEMVAHSIHRLSARASGPFIPVNCAALPETLVESTLFGHRKGAFTGAANEEAGLFRAADGGTVFLDEIGELSLAIQAKILRVLQEGVVLPVGSHQERRVDVRVVVATHRDLAEQVRSGGFREDLYHRLTAHVLRVPSLRERRFDIPQLFIHLLDGQRRLHPELNWIWTSAESGQPALPIRLMAQLVAAEWTGNVRELQNITERTALLNLKGGPFREPFTSTSRPPVSGPIPAMIAEPTPGPSFSPDALRVAGESLGLAPKTIAKLLTPEALLGIQAEAERTGNIAVRLRSHAAEALLVLLETHDFNQTAVAETLCVSRTTLIKIMDDLGLPRASDLSAEDIARAQAQAGGDIAAAARLLRVSPTALQKRLAALGRESA